MKYILSVAALVALVATAPAREPTSDDARRLAAQIDQLVAAGYAKAKIKPAPLVDDAAFFRRASIDITGKIPTVNDVRRFLSDKSPEKRVKAVERMLESAGYANHMSNIWAELLIPEGNTDFQSRFLVPTIKRWLRINFADNKPYDRMTHELLSLPMTQDNERKNFFATLYQGGGKPTPLGYYIAKQGKAEDMAASVARVFLGVRLECAQCHDHPFGKWKREEFWSQAAFFAGFKPLGEMAFYMQMTEAVDRREMTIPNTDRVAQARFLDGTNPKWKFKVGARETLADWITTKENPFFSKALVNRMWSQFFGVGLVDPVDDLVDDNKPSHPELLELLAKEFGKNDFDLRFLIKAIVLSETYQRASTIDNPRQDVRLLGYMPLKGLTADQLIDSVSVATGFRDNTPFQNRFFGNNERQAFMDKFGDQEKKTDSHTSIPQALTMMNNKIITDATNPDRSLVLGAIVSSSFMSKSEKIEALFLAALSRKPTAGDAKKFLAYVEKGKAEKKALSDVFWALLNSTEFKFNH